jgi:transcriptional antiterminator Rof (Rho-off)
MHDHYKPVVCAQHEAYEYAALKGLLPDLCWYDEAGML